VRRRRGGTRRRAWVTIGIYAASSPRNGRRCGLFLASPGRLPKYATAAEHRPDLLPPIFPQRSRPTYRVNPFPKRAGTRRASNGCAVDPNLTMLHTALRLRSGFLFCAAEASSRGRQRCRRKRSKRSCQLKGATRQSRPIPSSAIRPNVLIKKNTTSFLMTGCRDRQYAVAGEQALRSLVLQAFAIADRLGGQLSAASGITHDVTGADARLL
jgi:hypothetical protein